MRGTGVFMAVSVVSGSASGLLVAEGVSVPPIAMGTLLQAVKVKARRYPRIKRIDFMACLYW